MQTIDQAKFNFSPAIGLAVSVMVGFLVFAVALDLTWDQFRRVLKRPKAPGIGVVAQYLILPGVAFGIGLLMADTSSIALGLGSNPISRTHPKSSEVSTAPGQVHDSLCRLVHEGYPCMVLIESSHFHQNR